MNHKQSDADKDIRGNQKRAIFGVSALYAQGIFVTAIGFAFAVLVSRLLSVREFGQLTILILFVSIISTLGSLAIHYAAPRFISKTLGHDDRSVAQEIAFNMIVLGVALSFIVALVALLLIPTTLQFLEVGLSSDFPWYAFSSDAACSCFVFFAIGIEQGFKRYRRMAFLMFLIALMRYGVAAYFIVAGLGLNGIFQGFALGNLLGTLAAIISTYQIFGHHYRIDWSAIQQVLGFCVPLFVSMAVGVVNSNIGSVMLLSFGNVSLVGIYGIGISIASIYWIASRSMLNIGLPEQSAAYGARGVDGLVGVSRVISRYTFLSVPFLTILMGCITPLLVSVVFPSSYLEASLVAVLLFGVHSIFCYEIVSNGYLLAIGETAELMKTSLAAFAVGSISGIALIPLLGILGAVISKGAMDCVLALYPAYVIRKRFGFKFDFAFQARVFVPALGIILPAIALELLFPPLLALPLVVIAGVLVYLSGLRLLRVVNGEDLEAISSLFPNRGRSFILRVGTRLLLDSQEKQIC